MGPVGIICEYNPFHNGHRSQLTQIREELGPDTGIVCLMSGNYVQRGEPAIFPKQLRAEAAVRCGADLVLELPLTAALSSAEGFAGRGVEILTALGCEGLSFGSECGDRNLLMSTAERNLDPRFDGLVREHLSSGCSYPTARARALETLGCAAVSAPNDILAVEYCKAILLQGSPMQPLPIHRPGSYHAETLDPEAPSATALRKALQTHREPSLWRAAVPSCLRELYAAAPIHTMAAGERAVLAILRTLPYAAYEALPFGSEGLWSKFMKNARSCASVEEILAATKSKRYTLSRLRRMLLCAVLGLTEDDLRKKPPYVRVLAFNHRGRAMLRGMKSRFPMVNAGETPPDAAYYSLEIRASDLYSLFSWDVPRPGGEEAGLRVSYLPGL